MTRLKGLVLGASSIGEVGDVKRIIVATLSASLQRIWRASTSLAGPALASAVLVLGCASLANADIISTTFSGTFSGNVGGGPEDLAASATFSFDTVANILTVTLTNTSTVATPDLAGTLTGVFFDVNHTLTPVSAALGPGSVAVNGTLSNVGDGWGYGTSLSAQGKNSAISATGAVNGLGMSNFSASSTMLDGGGYGIVSAKTGNPSSFPDGLKNNGPQEEDSVVFTLKTGSGFTLTDLGSSVVFQYGTALSEPSITTGPGSGPHITPSVPEPTKPIALISLFGMGFVGLIWRCRKAAVSNVACDRM